MMMASACAHYSITIVEQQDGSALWQYRLGFNPQFETLISPQGVNPLDDWQERVQAQGFTVQRQLDEDWVEYLASKNVANLAEISLGDADLLGAIAPGQPFSLLNTIFAQRLVLESQVDLTGLCGNQQSEEAQLAQTLVKNTEMQFFYHTQRNILQHNAQEVRRDGDSNIFYWQLIPGENNKISLTASNLLAHHLAGLGALAALMIYYLAMAVYLLKYAGQFNYIGAEAQHKVPLRS